MTEIDVPKLEKHEEKPSAPARTARTAWGKSITTVWDLALTTQALTHVDRDLAFALSHAYNVQKVFNEFTRGMTQAMYLIPMRDNFDAFAQAAEVYYGDVVFMEPRLLSECDELIRQIDRALGD